jgi:hypothetical protein
MHYKFLVKAFTIYSSHPMSLFLFNTNTLLSMPIVQKLRFEIALIMHPMMKSMVLYHCPFWRCTIFTFEAVKHGNGASTNNQLDPRYLSRLKCFRVLMWSLLELFCGQFE